MTATDRVGTCNIKVTLSDRDADQVLQRFLHVGHPDLAGITEWDGPKPDLDPRTTDTRLGRATEGTKYAFARPADGGSPQIRNVLRFHLMSMQAVTLVASGFVGNLPGRKSTLPASVASVGIYEDLYLGGEAVNITVHLTAEVQFGAGYRRDSGHRLRVVRHRLERRALARLVRKHLRAGRRVYVNGDTNFDQMPLEPLTACWVGHRRAEQSGTLGRRSVDYVYAEDPAWSVQIIPTRSDHDGVVAVYPRKEK